jgi:hypothetical protein
VATIARSSARSSAGISPIPVQPNSFVQLSDTNGVSDAASPGPRSFGSAIRPS